MSRYEWLLFLHILSAFALVGGAVAIQAFWVASVLRERPSEIALLMRLAKIPELVINIGAFGVLIFGIWLALDLDTYSIWDGWILASLVLWVVAAALGGIGGSRAAKARLEAERLAGADDVATPALLAQVRDPLTAALTWGSAVTMLVILVLMTWKPGA
jgi:uncharacterized membrane protein